MIKNHFFHRKFKKPIIFSKQCGASVNPKEVEWFNDEIAQCLFCNVIMNNEK